MNNFKTVKLKCGKKGIVRAGVKIDYCYRVIAQVCTILAAYGIKDVKVVLGRKSLDTLGWN